MNCLTDAERESRARSTASELDLRVRRSRRDGTFTLVDPGAGLVLAPRDYDGVGLSLSGLEMELAVRDANSLRDSGLATDTKGRLPEVTEGHTPVGETSFVECRGLIAVELNEELSPDDDPMYLHEAFKDIVASHVRGAVLSHLLEEELDTAPGWDVRREQSATFAIGYLCAEVRDGYVLTSLQREALARLLGEGV